MLLFEEGDKPFECDDILALDDAKSMVFLTKCTVLRLIFPHTFPHGLRLPIKDEQALAKRHAPFISHWVEVDGFLGKTPGTIVPHERPRVRLTSIALIPLSTRDMRVSNVGVFKIEHQLSSKRRLTTENDIAVRFRFGHGFAHQVDGRKMREKDKELVSGN